MTQLRDDLLAPRFAALANLVDDSDWQEIVGSERPRRWMPSHHRRLLLAVAFAVAGLLVAAAFASGLADRFSSWVSGKPGRPAPAGLQHGFDVRNRAAYASFPAGTKLRLLLTRKVGGTTFNLLGFRNGDAYCLRLVRADLASGLGRNECLRAEELTGVPALVVGDVWFSVGKTAKNVNGVYGFAADNVRALRVERLRGSDQAVVVNNVFLSLRSTPAGSVQRHPLPNPVIAVHALLRGGGSRNIPYSTSSIGGGIVPGGTRPSGPSYFASPPRSAVPGPAFAAPGPNKVAAPITHPTIRWLKRHEPRGNPLPHLRFQNPVFGRVVQPDPDDPIRIGIGVGGRGALCSYYFTPLAPMTRDYGGGCGGWFQTGPIQLGSWLQAPIQHFNGIVADGITHVTAFLADGRIIQAALRDNVFEVAIPATELPGRIVGYDANNRVAGIVELGGNSVLKTCPRAAFTTPVSQLPPPKPWETLDLGALTVNGQHILGMTPQQVETALGKPAVVLGAAQRTNGVAIPEFRYGGQEQSTVGLIVSFSKKGSRIFANRLYFQSPSLVDAKLGHVLRVQPSDLQRAITRTYGGVYRLYLSYGSDPSQGCTAVLPRRNAPRGVSLGMNPYRPSRPYLTISANALG